MAEDDRKEVEILGKAACPINLAISDACMPKMDGLTLLRQVRGTGQTIPFLLITAFADVATVQVAKLGKADALTAKPLSPEHLEQKLL